MNLIAELTRGTLPSGVYRSRSRATPERLAAAAAVGGRRYFYLDGAQIRAKAALLDACARVFALPPYFGRNWDALADCLRDLSWAPASGYLILYDQAANLARHDPEAWAALSDLFAEMAAFWAGAGIPCTIIIRGAGASS